MTWHLCLPRRCLELLGFFLFSLFLFVAALGLCRCMWALSRCVERGPLLAAVHRSLTAVASLVVEQGL